MTFIFQRAPAAPRITPANSGLVTAAGNRPIRDPRLAARLAAAGISGGGDTQPPLASKPTALLDSNNKVVSTNKMSVRDIRSESRLLNNKDNAIIPPTSPPKSQQQPLADSGNRSKSLKMRSPRKTDSSEKATLLKSSLGSPVKSSKSSSDKSEIKSPSKSPSGKRKIVVGVSMLDKKKRDGKGVKSETFPTVFKGVKGSSKNRNYIRRNRSPTYSPEPVKDVDLRLAAPIGQPDEDKSCEYFMFCIPNDSQKKLFGRHWLTLFSLELSIYFFLLLV